MGRGPGLTPSISICLVNSTIDRDSDFSLLHIFLYNLHRIHNDDTAACHNGLLRGLGHLNLNTTWDTEVGVYGQGH